MRARIRTGKSSQGLSDGDWMEIMSTKDDQIQNLQVELNDTRAKLEEAEPLLQQLPSTQQELAQLRHDFTLKEQQHTAEREEMGAKEMDLLRRVDDLAGRLEEEENRRGGVETDLERSRSHVTDLEESALVASKEREALQEALSKGAEAMEDVSGRLNRLHSDHTKLASDHMLLEDKAAALERVRSHLLSQLAENNADMVSLRLLVAETTSTFNLEKLIAAAAEASGDKTDALPTVFADLIERLKEQEKAVEARADALERATESYSVRIGQIPPRKSIDMAVQTAPVCESTPESNSSAEEEVDEKARRQESVLASLEALIPNVMSALQQLPQSNTSKEQITVEEQSSTASSQKSSADIPADILALSTESLRAKLMEVTADRDRLVRQNHTLRQNMSKFEVRISFLLCLHLLLHDVLTWFWL